MKRLIIERDDKWGILELQNAILNIAKYVDEICKKHNIHYYLMGGSALGAVRHGGFIPWDDDLDIFMTPQNYEKFKTAFKAEGDLNRFYLQERGGVTGKTTYSKLRLNHSTYLEHDIKDLDINHGIYIDIFILHTSPNNIFKRIWQYAWAKYIVAKGLSNRTQYSTKGASQILLWILAKFPKRFLIEYALKQVYRFSNEESEYYCHFLGRARYKTGLYKRAYFGKPRYMQFEKTELSVPEFVEDYLRDRWGDYMKLPSQEEILKYQHAWKWSVSEVFPGYRPDAQYKDELALLP